MFESTRVSSFRPAGSNNASRSLIGSFLRRRVARVLRVYQSGLEPRQVHQDVDPVRGAPRHLLLAHPLGT